jgi:GAF domain-containing protein
MSLQDTGVRDATKGYAPVNDGKRIVIRGVVNAPSFHFPEYSLLSIEDGQYGAVIKMPGANSKLDGYAPGDDIEVTGTISVLGGMVVILQERIVPMGHTAPPAPADVAVDDLLGFRYLGRLVRAEARITETGVINPGTYLSIDSQSPYKLFIPHRQAGLAGPTLFRPGDRVRFTGVAYQFCQQPPYNRQFQLLVHGPSAIARVEASWFPAPIAVAVALAILLLIGFLLWSRERRLRSQREILRKTYQLGEEILGAGSVSDILKRVSESLPAILGVTRVRLYIFNRAGKTLEEVTDGPGGAGSISLTSPPEGAAAGAVACFHYRTLLVIPDIDRSPFPLAGKPGESGPRSLLFVPMLAQSELIGVLELDQDDRTREFSGGEQEMAQHLGNQIGVAIRLLDQRSVQEQLFRTEKLAAVGRLISGVVNELQAPLSSISDLAGRAMGKIHGSAAEREVGAIAEEAQKAAGMVARLVSFAANEQVEARPVPVSMLLRNLIDFRESDWKASGIRVRDLTTREPLFVLGSQGQLEQVFLNLLVHAEQSLADAPQKTITVRTSVLAKRLLVEIAFSAPSEMRKAWETAGVLGVTRSIIAGHGGEVRLIEKSNADPRFEVELPVIPKERVSGAVVAAANGHAASIVRRMTALVIEPEEAAQRQLLSLLAARGCRVVPVANADTGLELAHRMRFDLAFCSVHAPGLNWVELSERVQPRVTGFVLLSDGYDAELSSDFEGDGRFVLAKPVQESDLDRVLQMLEPPVPMAKNGAA